MRQYRPATSRTGGGLDLTAQGSYTMNWVRPLTVLASTAAIGILAATPAMALPTAISGTVAAKEIVNPAEILPVAMGFGNSESSALKIKVTFGINCSDKSGKIVSVRTAAKEITVPGDSSLPPGGRTLATAKDTLTIPSSCAAKSGAAADGYLSVNWVRASDGKGLGSKLQNIWIGSKS